MQQQQRNRTAAKRRAIRSEAGADFGPALRLRRDGRFAAWGGAAEVEIETRIDPEAGRHRIVRGARRRCCLLDLEARRVITKAMRDAAEQFLDDLSIASGGTAPIDPAMPSLCAPRAGPPERQVMAITRVNQVRRVLGLSIHTVTWFVVFGNGSLAAFEAKRRLRNGSATAMLRAELSALDEYYHRTLSKKAA